ncbi:hypothetical protein MBLNU230_g7625t1 [Neophaeotheca triangularis]
MPPPYRSIPLRKSDLPTRFKPTQYLRYSELPTTTKLIPHIRCIAWSATGVYLAQCVGSTIRVWNTDRDGRPGADTKARPSPGVEVKNAHGGVETVERIAWCPSREGLLASVGSDGKCRLWDFGLAGGMAGAPQGPKAGGLNGAAGGVAALLAVGECALGDAGWSLTWHPSGQQLLVGRQDDVVQAITLEPVPTTTQPPTKQSYTLHAHDSTPPRSGSGPDPPRSRNLNALAFSNPGTELLATTGDGRIHIYAYPSLTHLHTLIAHSQTTHAIAPSPAGNYIAAGGADALLTLWSTTSLLCSQTLTEHEKGVRDLSFSWDGAYIVAGSGKEAREVQGVGGKGDEERGNAGGLRFWHVDTGEFVHVVETNRAVGCVAWHPWRYWVAFAGEEGGVRVLGVGGSGGG